MNSTILPPISSALPGVLARSASVALRVIVDGMTLMAFPQRLHADEIPARFILPGIQKARQGTVQTLVGSWFG